MNNQTTIEKMKQLRLHAMAKMHYTAVHQNMYTNCTPDEYIALMIDQEWDARQSKRINNMIHLAGFRAHAVIQNIDYTAQRGLDKNQIERLLSLDFLKQRQNIIITGPTGVGKSYLTQAIGRYACTMLFKTLYFNTAKLFERFKSSRLEGTYLKFLKYVKKFDLLILDDFGLAPFDTQARQTLMDLIEERYDHASIIITSQIPVKAWYELIGESTIADAILDRIVNSSHRIDLNGQSLRKKIDAG